jgi:hypothetical protein
MSRNIKTLSCAVEDDETGRITDEALLLDELAALYMAEVKKNRELQAQLDANVTAQTRTPNT